MAAWHDMTMEQTLDRDPALRREPDIAADGYGRVANAVEIPWRRAPGMWMLGFSGGEVKGHRFDGLRESFPAINLSHLDLAGGEQRPE